MKKNSNNRIFTGGHWEEVHRHAFLPIVYCFFFLGLFISSTAFSQESTLNNYAGLWTDNTSWTSGSNPGVSGLKVDILINGFITRMGDLDFVNHTLTVEDTLIIYGNVTFGSNANLVIANGGIVIIYGDYTSGNNVSVVAGGYLIVTGEFNQTGADNHGSFDIDGGTVYIFNPGDIKTGDGFTDLQCNPDCGYGDSTSLTTDTLFNFFEGGGYTISASGPTTFCTGGSVVLSVPDEGANYQWYLDGTPIPGANTFTYTATTGGSYTLEMVVVSTTLEVGPEIVTVDTYSTAPVSAVSDRDNICASDGDIVLGYSGGTVGTNATAEWYSDASFGSHVGTGNNLTLAAPMTTTTYYVRFEGACNMTSAVNVTVNVTGISSGPASASVNLNNLCPANGNIILSYLGGTLAPGAAAEWYSDAAFTTHVGTGNNLNLATPNVTTTYYVRFEGCNTTAAQSVTVNIKDLSVAPTSATVDVNDLCPATGNIVLSYSGGTLGTNATAEWYSDATFSTHVGSGNNLSSGHSECHYNVLCPL